MRKLTIVAGMLSLVLSSCTYGPFVMTHKKGHMPKLYANAFSGEIHARGDDDEIMIRYIKEFD